MDNLREDTSTVLSRIMIIHENTPAFIECLEILSYKAVMESDIFAKQYFDQVFAEDKGEGYRIHDGEELLLIPPSRDPFSLTEQQLDRQAIYYLHYENENLGSFRKNLKVLNLNVQLKIIQYLIQKVAETNHFTKDIELEVIIQYFDPKQIFESLDLLIKKIIGREVCLSSSQRASIQALLINFLRKTETEFLVQIELNKKLAVFKEALHVEGGAAPYRFAMLVEGLQFFTRLDMKKKLFLENLKVYLAVHQEEFSRAELLDLFKELQVREGPLSFIHIQKNPRWDRFRTLFKSCCGSERDQFWHTTTYNKTLTLLIKSYLLLAEPLPFSRVGEEFTLLSYAERYLPSSSLSVELFSKNSQLMAQRF